MVIRWASGYQRNSVARRMVANLVQWAEQEMRMLASGISDDGERWAVIMDKDEFEDDGEATINAADAAGAALGMGHVPTGGDGGKNFSDNRRYHAMLWKGVMGNMTRKTFRLNLPANVRRRVRAANRAA
jgi:hypothetical protein